MLGNPRAGDGSFVPLGKLMLVGYQMCSFACLDCGFIGSCLSEEFRCKLEVKFRDN